MLMTAPLRDGEVVLCKYAASFGFYLLMWLPTLLYLPIILSARTAEGPVDWRPVLSSILGIVLVGAMFLALGLFISSLVKSQLVAALLSMCASLVFVIAGFWRPDIDFDTAGFFTRMFYYLSSYLSVPLHFQQDFSRGIVDTRHIVLYLSVTVFCLFLTVRSLESRRWR
jgi:ABC-type transport system involved in multi-copper enzyme maturation permease subunit